jgi:hypothetical protein
MDDITSMHLSMHLNLRERTPFHQLVRGAVMLIERPWTPGLELEQGAAVVG